MPRVPRVQRSIAPTPLPSARLTATETPTSTGAGLALARERKFAALGQLGGAIAQLGETVGQIQIAERRDAHAVALEAQRQAEDVQNLANDNQLSAWVTQRLYDPQRGALQVQGRDTLPLAKGVMTEFNDVANGIEAGLATDRQRLAFRRRRLVQEANLDLTLQRHTAQQMDRYDAAESQAAIDQRVNGAIRNATDPRRVGQELESAVQAARGFGTRHGLGPAAIDAQVQAITSKTHVGVIAELLAQDRTKAATVYFEETRDQIATDALPKIEKALQEGSTRKAAQTQADAILAEGGTLTAQRDKAKRIDDPEERDAVLAYLEHENIVHEKAVNDAEREQLRRAYDLVDRSHNVLAISPADWKALDGPVRSALRSYADHLAGEKPIETDWEVWTGLMQEAGTTPDTFVAQNLYKYRAVLNDVEFKQLQGIQLSLANNKPVIKELAGFSTNSQILASALDSYKIDPNPKPGTQEAAALGQLRRMLDLSVLTQSALENGKEPTNVDKRRMIDDILSESITVPGSFWNLWPGGKSYSDTSKRLIDSTIEDVPANERRDIEAALRVKGRPVSDVTVLDLWLERRLRTRK